MKRFEKALSILASLVLVSLAQGRPDDFGEVTPDAPGAKIIREGNTMTFIWYHPTQWGYNEESASYYPIAWQRMEFGLIFHRGLDQMQDVYARFGHGLFGGGDGPRLNYNQFVKQDPYREDLGVLASSLLDLARQHGLNQVDVALSFVQSLPYQKMGYYQRYAVETLIDGMGDCSDTSMLFAGILAAWRIGAIFLDYPTHLAVGVWTEGNQEGWHYDQMGRKYYYCETTGVWRFGNVPSSSRRDAYLIPVECW